MGVLISKRINTAPATTWPVVQNGEQLEKNLNIMKCICVLFSFHLTENVTQFLSAIRSHGGPLRGAIYKTV